MIHDISSKTDKNYILSSSDMVVITLRYLATGAIGQLIGDSNCIVKVPKVYFFSSANFDFVLFLDFHIFF
jgi:hypothetical protein